MRIIFFGTPLFAAKTLEFLLDKKCDIVAVVSKPDKPRGRSLEILPTPVKEVVCKRNCDIPLFQPEKASSPEFIESMSIFEPDLFVVVAYGEIIKQALLDVPKFGCINVHASLLPKFRGAAPIQRAIIEGEKESGITIMYMEKRMDAGDIIKKVIQPIPQDMTSGALEQNLLEKGCECLFEVIQDFEQGKFERTPQDHSLATFAPKIELEDCEIHWDQAVQNVYNLIRGVTPYPGAWCYVNIRGEKKRLKIKLARLAENVVGTPGSIVSLGREGMVVACRDGGIRLLLVQLEGKKEMEIFEMMKGIPLSQFSLI